MPGRGPSGIDPASYGCRVARCGRHSGGNNDKFKGFLLVPAAILAVTACGRDDSSKKVDEALNADLYPGGPGTTLHGDGQHFGDGARLRGSGACPGWLCTRRGMLRCTASHSQPFVSGSCTGIARFTAASSTAFGPAQDDRVKHTKRDAAIGAAAGAAIGAVTSRDKLKGAVIGGVAGAVLGGVIGNNVDVQRR